MYIYLYNTNKIKSIKKKLSLGYYISLSTDIYSKDYHQIINQQGRKNKTRLNIKSK